eukprot:Opistho-1_new@61574
MSLSRRPCRAYRCITRAFVAAISAPPNRALRVVTTYTASHGTFVSVWSRAAESSPNTSQSSMRISGRRPSSSAAAMARIRSAMTDARHSRKTGPLFSSWRISRMAAERKETPVSSSAKYETMKKACFPVPGITSSSMSCSRTIASRFPSGDTKSNSWCSTGRHARSARYRSTGCVACCPVHSTAAASSPSCCKKRWRRTSLFPTPVAPSSTTTSFTPSASSCTVSVPWYATSPSTRRPPTSSGVSSGTDLPESSAFTRSNTLSLPTYGISASGASKPPPKYTMCWCKRCWTSRMPSAVVGCRRCCGRNPMYSALI